MKLGGNDSVIFLGGIIVVLRIPCGMVSLFSKVGLFVVLMSMFDEAEAHAQSVRAANAGEVGRRTEQLLKKVRLNNARGSFDFSQGVAVPVYSRDQLLSLEDDVNGRVGRPMLPVPRANIRQRYD